MQIFLCLYFHIYFFANIFTFYSVQIDTVSLILYNKLINTAWLWGKSMKNDKIIKKIKKAYLIPAEMENIIIDKSLFENNLPIKLEVKVA